LSSILYEKQLKPFRTPATDVKASSKLNNIDTCGIEAIRSEADVALMAGVVAGTSVGPKLRTMRPAYISAVQVSLLKGTHSSHVNTYISSIKGFFLSISNPISVALE
jgi:hypothetical protein